ncbi:MAG: hypothetical protein JXC32_12460 [Anaerolineae bacterium]|nr:hypothetical protein [Anaerolineae bacterium]
MADFCTVADVANFLQIEIAADDASCLRAIAEATAAIKNHCHQEIELVSNETITLDCAGGTKLFLPELPVQSVAEVVEDDEILTVDDDYKLGQWGILHRVDDEWASGIQIIEITYTHGYATPLPDDVVSVCVRAASRAYQMGLKTAATDGIAGIQSLSLGDYAITYSAEATGGAGEGTMGASGARMLLMSEKDMLNKYRYVAQ